jgi:molecular chaperone HtpG
MSVEAHKETLGFQAEVKQLLQLMINSLYSNKEIFLRELVSNSADAADKLRFEALSDDALFEDDPDLKIRVSFDKDTKTVKIEDNGIGMSRQEVIDNVGTIAKSGTRQFLDSLTGDQAKDSNLIGQFGVGLYSAFIVADKLTLDTRRAGLGAEHGVRWVSAGEGEYTIETIEKKNRGTSITLHLREAESEFLDGMRLRSIIQKYSDHIMCPILMEKEEFDDKGEKKAGNEDETVNSASALWAKSKSEITEEEYNEFYKHVAHDFEDPLLHLHSRVEGKLEYSSLLYLPKKAPFDMWNREARHGVKLYVKRVFIMDDAEQLMPGYLRFVRGVIDTNDLPLNVSREILQKNKVIDSIRSGSVKKILGALEKMAKNDKDKYAEFWGQFGNVIKEGPGEDFSNRDKIAKLLRFSSTHTDNETQDVSLEDYVSRMKEGQDKIYYIAAENFTTVKNSPHLEVFRQKGLEALLLSDRVDEWLMSSLTEFDGKIFQSVTKGELDLGDVEDEKEKEQKEKTKGEFKDLVGKIQETLKDEVKEVRMTNRLTSSPACLVNEAYDMSANLERMLKEAGQNVAGTKPVFELNPQHPLVAKLKNEEDEERFDEWTHILFDQALLSEGGQLSDPAMFVTRLNKLLLELSQPGT